MTENAYILLPTIKIINSITNYIIMDYYSIEFNRNRKSTWIVSIFRWCKNCDPRNDHQMPDNRRSCIIIHARVTYSLKYFMSTSSGYCKFTINNKFILNVCSHHSLFFRIMFIRFLSCIHIFFYLYFFVFTWFWFVVYPSLFKSLNPTLYWYLCSFFDFWYTILFMFAFIIDKTCAVMASHALNIHIYFCFLK